MKRKRMNLGLDVDDDSPLKCPVIAKPGTLTVRRCEEPPDEGMFSLYAMHRGRPVGQMLIEAEGKRLAKVGLIEVHPSARRLRVGTRLYELALRQVCKAGRQMSSDTYRSAFAESFWRKQESKGRAVCAPAQAGEDPKADAVMQGDYAPAPGTPGLPSPEDVVFNSKGVPSGKWPCRRYVMNCAATSLEGTQKRSRRSAKAKRRAR